MFVLNSDLVKGRDEATEHIAVIIFVLLPSYEVDQAMAMLLSTADLSQMNLLAKLG